eukprot:10409623-Ditylum_brightwellii.AAC.1
MWKTLCLQWKTQNLTINKRKKAKSYRIMNLYKEEENVLAQDRGLFALTGSGWKERSVTEMK